ncbi:MAG: hypothetical protein KAS39_07020 [Actinomycetia bacterium]|nr:hypothetical protein [Actinomycetes bacterium]
MDCPHCGAEVSPNVGFCSLCLKSIKTNKNSRMIDDPIVEKSKSLSKDEKPPGEKKEEKEFSDEEIAELLKQDVEFTKTSKLKDGINRDLIYSLSAAVTLTFVAVGILILTKNYIAGVVVFVQIFLAFFCYQLAIVKGRTGFGWWFGGLFFSIFALMTLILLPSFAKAGYTKTCSSCKEIIKEEAEVCRYCGTKY